MKGKKTALYIRVSTEMQVDKDSLTTQEEQLVDYCKKHGVTQYKIYKDKGFSAKDTNRPELEKLLRDIKNKEIERVITTKLDRISRSLADLLKLIELFQDHAVDYVSIGNNIDTSSPEGRLMYSLVGTFAQFEREIIAERVSKTMNNRAKKGK